MASSASPFVRRANSETALDVNGRDAHVLIGAPDNNNQMCLIEYFSTPGHEPPPHLHVREDEYFYILSGSMEAHCGGQVLQANPGDLLFFPKNTPHAWHIQTPALHTLILFTPASGANVFIELGVPKNKQAADYYGTHFTAPDSRRKINPTMEDILKLASRNEVHYLTEEEIARDLPQYKPRPRLIEGV